MIAASRRRGFTMVELLIVIAIIAVLMGMLIAVIPNVIYNAKALKTASRIDAVLQGLSRVGQQEGSAAMIMQRNAHLGPVGRSGVYQFDTAHSARMLQSRADTTAAGSSNDNRFYTDADLALPYIFGFPWGKIDLICPTATTASAAADPNSVAGKTPRPLDPMNPTPTYYFVSNVTLDQLDVQNQWSDAGGKVHLSSVELMKMAEILTPDDPLTPADESQTSYFTDRSTERAWNDAWGDPLVIAWGIFQPGGSTPADGATDDQFTDPAQNIAGARCAEAWRQYQYNRSVYIAVASAGPDVCDVGPDPRNVTTLTPIAPASYTSNAIGDWPPYLLQIWNEANAVCQADAPWNSDAFDTPPWQGIKKGKTKINGRTLRCQLSQPHEFK